LMLDDDQIQAMRQAIAQQQAQQQAIEKLQGLAQAHKDGGQASEEGSMMRPSKGKR
jgi:hypothetical protein